MESSHITSKHRVWLPKHRLVRSVLDTFKELECPNRLPFVPQKTVLAGIYQLHSPLVRALWLYDCGLVFFKQGISRGRFLWYITLTADIRAFKQRGMRYAKRMNSPACVIDIFYAIWYIYDEKSPHMRRRNACHPDFNIRTVTVQWQRFQRNRLEAMPVGGFTICSCRRSIFRSYF